MKRSALPLHPPQNSGEPFRLGSVLFYMGNEKSYKANRAVKAFGRILFLLRQEATKGAK